MAKLDVIKLNGEKASTVELNDAIWNIEVNEIVLSEAVRLQMASLRQGTHDTKGRSEVSGGGRKPWRQKGTGRARQGSIRAVQWVGGGNYGTPVPRDYSKKQNRKERRLALKSALSDKALEKAIMVVENISLSTPKTKEMLNLLEALKVADKKVLLVVKEFDDNLILASRNLQNVVLIAAEEINVLDLVSTDVMVITEEALKTVEEVLK